MNNFFLNNIFTIPCDECYSIDVDSNDNMLINDYSELSRNKMKKMINSIILKSQN